MRETARLSLNLTGMGVVADVASGHIESSGKPGFIPSGSIKLIGLFIT
jgi:hypothetical protein